MLMTSPWSVKGTGRAAVSAAGILLLVFLLASVARGAEAGGKDDPAGFVRGLGDQAIAVLTEPGLDWAQRQDRLRKLLNQGFALEAIGRFVLGKHWRRASQEERSRFLAVYEDFLMAHYVQRMQQYAGEQLEIEATKDASGEGAIVQSSVTRSDGLRVRVDWRLQRVEARWSIVDVVVEGVSLALTHRSEFASVIRTKGGLEGLLKALQEASRRSETKPSSGPTTS
ncbi:MAG: ABC transporter substrate-binding protein [Kiloniellales bacterium]|nr:ABC transporter substrate-binding protein [Kiloniellales bacterium]